jgi:hypothetical protein
MYPFCILLQIYGNFLTANLKTTRKFKNQDGILYIFLKLKPISNIYFTEFFSCQVAISDNNVKGMPSL